MKRFLYAVLGLLGVCVLTVYFGWSPLMEKVVLDALKNRPKDLNIGWKRLKVSGTELSIESVEGWIPLRLKGSPVPLPLPFAASDVAIRVPIMSVLSLAPQVAFSGRAYGGSISGTVSAITSGKPILATELKGLTLTEHPIVQGAWFIQSGTLSISTPKTILSPNPELIESNFDAALTQVNIAELPQQLTRIPVPAIKNGSLLATGSVKGGVLSADSITIDSNLLTATGRLKVVVPQGSDRSTCEGDLLISLTDEGYAALGTALRLAAAVSGTQIPEGNRRFTLRFTGMPGRGNGSASCARIGPWCISAKIDLAS
jgi:hypothetical protein